MQILGVFCVQGDVMYLALRVRGHCVSGITCTIIETLYLVQYLRTTVFRHLALEIVLVGVTFSPFIMNREKLVGDHGNNTGCCCVFDEAVL